MDYKNKSILILLSFSLLSGFQDSELVVPGFDCGDCHGSGGWDRLTLSGFNHNTTELPLKGIHKIQNCSACHTGTSNKEKHQFSKDNFECTSCHIDIHKSELGDNCTQCHTEQTWTVNSQSFDHNTTLFPLTNGHKSVQCSQCHFGESSSNFTLTSTECSSCHLQDYSMTGTLRFPSSPNHEILNYTQDCLACHNTQRWTDAIFDHSQTNFPLTDAHETVECQTCHANQNYDLPLTCEGCHIEGGLATTNSGLSEFDHNTHQINSNCESCHGTNVWTALIFDHINFSNNSCEECHIPEYTDSADPPHANDNISIECQTCHATTSNWDITPFQHLMDQTGYVLEGAHENASCESCHLNNVFVSTPQDCWSCHATEYEQTGTSTYPDSPNHSSLGYSQTCNVCHEMNTWEGALFNHDETDFPLVDAHETVECQTCHANQNYDLPLTCEGCHIEGGLATTNSGLSEFDHNTHQINSNCESCHGTNVWTALIFDHINFSNNSCEECHIPEYTDSADPPHANGNIQENCILCHESTSTWVIENFLHSSSQTEYELTGLHLVANCEACHLNDIYNATPQSCDNPICHLSDFESTTDPNHGEYAFPIASCTHCHTTLGWEPDIFEHDIEVACATCHMPDYTSATDPSHENLSTTCDQCHLSTTDWEDATFSHDGITNDCVSCHLNDYNETSSHINDDYPTECEMCHTSTSDWDETSFNHDNSYFPIFNGEHEGEWSTCTAECHTFSADYTQFSCGLNGVCHEHDQDDMDDEHDDEDDYIYESSACYDCHPDGEDDDLRFRPIRQKKKFLKKFPGHIPN